jgi:hypothetical protein
MIHVFLLLVYLGTGDDRKLISNNMYFYDINRCNYFAKEISKRYGNYYYLEWLDNKDRVTSYCIPKYLEKDSVKVY